MDKLPLDSDPLTWNQLNNPSDAAIASICVEVQNGDKTYVLVGDEGELLKVVKTQFTVFKAGGGFVYTPEKKVLLIFRHGKWDLPKGKLDEGETLESCAIREVEEETGVKVNQIEKAIQVTYHHYTERDQSILKENHWYLMSADEQTIKPQTEEDIERGKWVSFDQLSSYLENTHPSIRDVVIAAQQWLA